MNYGTATKDVYSERVLAGACPIVGSYGAKDLANRGIRPTPEVLGLRPCGKPSVRPRSDKALVATGPDQSEVCPLNAVVRLSRGDFDAVVMDLDGVVTDTASLHEKAWKRLFDGFLAAYPPGKGDHRPLRPEDYRRFVDGRPRRDGVVGFLTSRGIEVPPEKVEALAAQKDRDFLDLLMQEGVRLLPGAVPLLNALRMAGFRTAIVSASRNCRMVLEHAGIAELFDARVDGVIAADLGLPGKPHPAVYLEAARRLGTATDRAVVVEDALPGVEAGRRGGFGLVVGVGDSRHGRELLAHGADVVVPDLAGFEVAQSPAMERPRS